MGRLARVARRVRGVDKTLLAQQVADTREMVASINHRLGAVEDVLQALNHDVRTGSEDVLPMFLGYAQRFRTDADTMVGVTELIERQLALITEQVERLAATAQAVSASVAATEGSTATTPER
jgi:uncharacterized small protein (DUF1192 family)